MKFLKYLTVLAAVVGLTAACTTDIEKTQIAPLDEVVVPVLHELPETAITINEETSSDKMKLTWDKADFKAPVSILYAVCAKVGDNSVELMTGITATEAELSNSTLSRLHNAVEKGGLAIEYEVPTVVNIYISAKVGANNVVYSESRELELTIFEIREPIKVYAHSEGGWPTCFIYGWDLAGCNFGDWPGTEITSNKETVNGKEYYYFEIPREAEGNTGNIIFNTGDGKQTQDITGVKMDESHYFTIAAEATDGKYIATEQVLPKKIKLYARSLAGWSKMYLYGWDVKGVSFEWPGEEITMTEFVDDLEWFVYELPMEAFETTGNIIFNNGDGQQTVDITSVKFSKNRFYEISAAPGADGKFTYTEIGGGNEPEPEPEPEPGPTPEPSDFKIYVDVTATGWTNCNIWAWDDANVNYTGGTWPGQALTLEDDKYVWVVPETAAGKTISVIFNNGTAQTADITDVVLDQDHTFVLNADLSWTMDGAQPDPEVVTFNIDVTATGWTNCNIWAWDDANVNYTGGSWPGQALELKDGKYVWVVPAEAVGKTISVIFNNGTAQTADITGIDASKNHSFVVAADMKVTIDGASPIPTFTDYAWALAGTFNQWGNLEMTVADGWATATVDFAAGAEFKVKATSTWDVSFGHSEDGKNVVVGSEFEVAFNGKNMLVENAGKYNVAFTIVDGKAKMKVELAN